MNRRTMLSVIAVLALFNHTSTLSIADKLQSPFSSDCFKRISIGQRLLHYDVTRTVRKNTVKGCEDECNIYECTFFSFGISAGGNGTCELSIGREISKRQATDYDLYQRTKECSSGKPTGYEEGRWYMVPAGHHSDADGVRIWLDEWSVYRYSSISDKCVEINDGLKRQVLSN